jgi:hypothetical protein
VEINTGFQAERKAEVLLSLLTWGVCTRSRNQLLELVTEILDSWAQSDPGTLLNLKKTKVRK